MTNSLLLLQYFSYQNPALWSRPGQDRYQLLCEIVTPERRNINTASDIFSIWSRRDIRGNTGWESQNLFQKFFNFEDIFIILESQYFYIGLDTDSPDLADRQSRAVWRQMGSHFTPLALLLLASHWHRDGGLRQSDNQSRANLFNLVLIISYSDPVWPVITETNKTNIW